MSEAGRTAWWCLAVVAWLAPAAAQAGPPFLTDDPEPTDAGH